MVPHPASPDILFWFAVQMQSLHLTHSPHFLSCLMVFRLPGPTLPKRRGTLQAGPQASLARAAHHTFGQSLHFTPGPAP